jgi:hypothetical protein
MSQVYREYYHSLLIIVFLLLSIIAIGQDKDVEDVKKHASELFEQGDYLEAKDLFSQLVSLYPKDENFNYKFGACLLFVDVDKTYPLKFLEYAVSRPNVDDEAFYFLGKGYHYNYRFDEAIKYFNRYSDKIADLKVKKYDVESDIRYCQNGKKLLRDVNSPLVLSKKKVGRNEFFTSFKMSDMGGRSLFAPKELQSAIDRKKGYNPVMYRNSNSDIIFFTSYGANDKNGIDIFSVTMLSDGELSKPVRLPETINTPFDEGFPFLNEDQDIFYFASKGHNSMGGYDLFKVNYNSSSNFFANPVNLDYSINTPDDDLMYADLKSEGVAYFASNRNCEKGKVYVYQINSNLESFEIAALSGVFNSVTTKSCKITVEDLDAHMIIGTYNTDKKSGEYLMRLKNGGHYKFLVEPYGSNVAYQGRVELPDLSEMKLLKQEIEIVTEGENEKLIIRNLFEELPEEEDQALLSRILIAEANIEEERAPKITISNTEMVEIVKTDKQKLESYLGDLQSKSNTSYYLANQKRELAQRDLEIAEQLESQISLNDNSDENLKKQEELTQLMQDAKTHSLEAEAAFNVGKNIEAQAEDVAKKLNKYDGYIVRIDNANDEGLSDKVEELFQQYKVDNEVKVPESPETELKKSLNIEQEKVSSLIKRAENVTVEQNEIRQDISLSKAQLNATKKKKEKEIIQSEIDDLYTELAPMEGQKEQLYEKSRAHELAALKYENELKAMEEVAQSQNEDVTVDDATEEQKDALINSIVATNEEIEALESSTTDQIKTTAQNQEGNSEENSALESASTSNEVVTNSDEGNVVDSAETGSTNLEEVAVIDGADLIEPEPESNDTALIVETTPIIEIAENEIIGQDNTQEEISVINTESPLETPQDDAEIFEYTSEYESIGNNVVEVDGENIPLDITSNTGKRSYKIEELKGADVVLDESEYNSDFKEEYEDVKQVESAYDKAKETQSINYNWVVSIEKEVAELSYAKTQTDNTIYKSRINDKITDLNNQAAQKRNFMALNARIIKQLENKESEAEYIAQHSEEVESQNENSENSEDDEGLNTELVAENQNEASENESNTESSESGNLEGAVIPVVIPAENSEGESNETNTGNEIGNAVGEEENTLTENQNEASENESNNESSEPGNLEGVVTPVVIPAENSEGESNETSTGNETGNAVGEEENSLTENQNEASENESNTEISESGNLEGGVIPVVIPTENSEDESNETSTGNETGNAVGEEENSLTENIEEVNETPSEIETTPEESVQEDTNIDENFNNTELNNEENNDDELTQVQNVEVATVVIQSLDERNEEIEVEAPSQTIVNEIETKKLEQVDVVTEKKAEVDNLNTELELTKKKKIKRAIQEKLLIAEAEVEYENKRMRLLNAKTVEIKSAEESMRSNPLSSRPSEAKYQQANSLTRKTDNLELELEELESKLAETKKKKHRRVVEAEIQDVRRELELSKIEAEVARETAQEMEEVEILTLKEHTAYGKEEMVKLPEVERELTIEEKESTEQFEAYIEYSNEKETFEKQIAEADVLYTSGVKKNEEAIALNNEVSLLNEGMELLPKSEQDSLRMLIVEKKEVQKRLISEADVYYQKSKAIKNEAYFNLNEANSELLVLESNEEKTQILALISGSIEKQVEPSYDSTNIDAIPENLIQDIFVDSDTTFYSETRPIPVDVELPEGVILKVQIGAFRNPIKQETFRGFAPIVGERTESGLTRYTAGLFKDFESVNIAKDGIRAKGYKDAFVVAYLNGKRISIGEARRIIAGEISEQDVASQATPAPQQIPQEDVSVDVQTVQSSFIDVSVNDVVVSDVKVRGELYFTVQVGVYSANISPKTVLNLSPLNQERIPNNLVRYSSGVYGNLAQAIVARNNIVQNGISDAFVTAYYQGERITISRAKQLAVEGSSSTNTVNSEPVEIANPNVSSNQEGKTYVVTIGPYTGSIPVEQARIILGLGSYGVTVEKNNNATLYKIGSFANQNEANDLRNDLVSKGLINPVVVESE